MSLITFNDSKITLETIESTHRASTNARMNMLLPLSTPLLLQDSKKEKEGKSTDRSNTQAPRATDQTDQPAPDDLPIQYSERSKPADNKVDAIREALAIEYRSIVNTRIELSNDINVYRASIGLEPTSKPITWLINIKKSHDLNEHQNNETYISLDKDIRLSNNRYNKYKKANAKAYRVKR